MVSGYKQIFLVEIPQKVENINRAICFAFIFLPLLRSVSVRNSAISSSDPPFFVHFILRNLVSNQIYHRSASFPINIPSVSVVSNQIFHRSSSFPIKYTIGQRRFQSNIPSNRWFFARAFHKLLGNFLPTSRISSKFL